MSTYHLGVSGSKKSLDPNSQVVATGYYTATTLSAVDSDLTSTNIKTGMNIFGITGTAPAASTIPATGQTMIYQTNDNGSYIKPTSARNFVDNGDGTITDVANNLMWATAAGATANFSTAIGNAAGVTLGGHTGWRLPNVRELQGLANYAISSPVYAFASFQGGNGRCWSSTSAVPFTTNYDQTNAMYVTFNNDASDSKYNGAIMIGPKANSICMYRACRNVT